MIFEFPDVELVQLFHRFVIEELGGTSGEYPDRVESAVGAVEQYAYYNSDADVFDITAAIAFYLAKGHCFTDGNKRTAMLTALYFLKINHELEHHIPRIAEMMEQLAEGTLVKEDLAKHIRSQFT